MGLREEAEQSDTVRTVIAIPTVLNMAAYLTKDSPDMHSAFIGMLEDTLKYAKLYRNN